MSSSITSSNAHHPAPPPQIPTSPIPPTGPHLPTPTPSLSDQTVHSEDFARFAHYAAIGCLITVPLIIAAPPRKLDFYTFTLLGCGVISGNHLVKERYNMGMLGLLGEKLGFAEKQRERVRLAAAASSASEGAQSEGKVTATIRRAEQRAEDVLTRWDLPTERSRMVRESVLGAEEQVRLRRAGRGFLVGKAEMLRQQGWGYGADMKRMLDVARQGTEEDGQAWGLPGLAEGESESLGIDAVAGSTNNSNGNRAGIKGVAKKVWYGDEDESTWRVKREIEENEALEDGTGYGGMIMQQIWEVWNWDKRKNDDGDWVTKREYENKYPS